MPVAVVSIPTIGPPFYGSTTLGHVDGRDVGDGSGYHPGAAVDFQLPIGRPLRAVADATVVVVGEETDDTDLWPRQPGRFVLLELDVPRSTMAFCAYKHMSEWSVVEGQHLTEGEVLGLSGSTQAESNPHLHFDGHPSLESWQEGSWATQVGWRMEWRRGDGTIRAESSWEMRSGWSLTFRPV